MAVDIKLFLNSDGQTYGPKLGPNGDFIGTDGLDTSIYVSLLTDSRASESEVVKEENRGGWIGNLINSDGSEIGSLLWLIEQKRRTSQSLAQAVDIVEKALNWYIEDGLLKEIEVTGALTQFGGIITITLITLSGDIDTKYVPLWKETV